MYAIFETGGKQYQVEPGDVIKVEKIEGNVGDIVKFDKVLAINDDKVFTVGTPILDAASVNAKITEFGKGEKVIIFKFKAKKDYRNKQGHRQPYAEIEIVDFTLEGKNIGKAPAKKSAPAKKVETADAEDASKAQQKSVEPKEEKADKPDKEDAKSEIKEAVKAETPETSESKPADAPKEEGAKKTSMTKADIAEKLDALGVDYLKSAKKDELLALLEEAESKA